MDNVEFDFSIAAQADIQLEEVTYRIKEEVLNPFEELMQELSREWSGEAGSQFQQLAVREDLQLKQTGRYLEDAQGALKEAICTAKQIEEKTKEIARLRTY